MGKYFIDLKDEAIEDFKLIYKSGDKASIKKLEKIVYELAFHPTIGIGNPEPLKYELTGLWSRRINKKDRIIYEVIEEPDNLVVIISALGHY